MMNLFALIKYNRQILHSFQPENVVCFIVNIQPINLYTYIVYIVFFFVFFLTVFTLKNKVKCGIFYLY